MGNIKMEKNMVNGRFFKDRLQKINILLCIIYYKRFSGGGSFDENGFQQGLWMDIE